MYTKGTQTIQMKREEYVTPPNALTDTPTKPHHSSSPRLLRHYEQQHVHSEEESATQSQHTLVNQNKEEKQKEEEQEVISFEETQRILSYQHFSFSYP
jgi:hypothetical protein